MKDLLAHLDLLVLLEEEDHQDLLARSVSLVFPDPLAHQDHLERKETLERSEDQVQLDVTVFKDLLVYLDPQETLVLVEMTETRENKVLPELVV